MVDERRAVGIILPGDMERSFEECVLAMQDTRDIRVYLDALNAVKDKYLIILGVKDTPGGNMPDEVLRKIKELGFQNLTKNFRQMYVGIRCQGRILFDKSGDMAEDIVAYQSQVEHMNLSVTSKAWGKGNVSEIIINDTDYSLNGRGLNFVVYDCGKNVAVDSSAYDSFVPRPTFYHKNLKFTEDYFDKHFYIPCKYKEIWREPHRKRYSSDRKLGVKEIENGLILPNKVIQNKVYGGVCDEKFHFVSGHVTHSADTVFNSRHISGSYHPPEEEVEYLDETVVYGGSMIDHPGHLIIESFADRMWWFVEHPDSRFKAAIVNIWGRGGARFPKEFLEAFGFSEDRIIWVKKPTRFKKIIVPDQSSVLLESNGRAYDFTREYMLPFKQILRGLKPAADKKIYFTKTKTARNNIIGEEYFINFYEKKGFKIVNPEDCTLREKAEYLMDADEFVTPVGTNSLYSVFCKPDVKLTILSRTNNNSNNIQAFISEAAGVRDICYVDVSMNFLHKHFVDGISLMGVTEAFRNYVKDTYHEVLDVSPADSLKSNLYEYLKYFPEYYANPVAFNLIKNQSMLTVLQNMSEVFLGEEFDTSRLDLGTTQSALSEKAEQSTRKLDFLQRLFHDILTQNRFIRFLSEAECGTVSLLCDDDGAAEIFREIFRLLKIGLLCRSSKVKCAEVPEKEWQICRNSDLVLGISTAGTPIGRREGAEVIDIRDIVSGRIPVKGQAVPGVMYHVEMLAAVKEAKDKLERQVSVLAEQMAQMRGTLQREEALRSQLQGLTDAKEKLREEKNRLEIQLLLSRQEYEHRITELTQERRAAKLEAAGRIEKLERELLQAGQALEDGKRKLEQEKQQRREERQKAETQIREIGEERTGLKESLERLQNSKSWRLTKPLRSLRWFCRRNPGGTS